MNTVDFYCSMEHYIDHVYPVFQAMFRRRGHLCIVPRRTMFDRAAWYGINARNCHPLHSDNLVVVAGGTDLSGMRRAALLEHGAGQQYKDLTHVSWGGGTERDAVEMFIVPNQTVAYANRTRYPNTPNVIAAPRVEHLLIQTAATRGKRDLIVFSRHWSSALTPELQSSWPHHFVAIREFCLQNPDRVALHFHRRCEDVGRSLAREWDIPYIETFDEVVSRAALYVSDSSSTGFEFAAMPGYRPVVWLNAPHYRRDVEQGLRFWRHVDVGDQCDEPGDLPAAIDNALTWPAWRVEQQAEHVRRVFPYIIGSAERAARAIEAIA